MGTMGTLLLAAALTITTAQAPDAQPATPAVKLLPVPADGAAIALADARNLPAHDAPHVRYLFLPDAPPATPDGWESVQAAVLTLNYLSSASVPHALPPPGAHPFDPMPAIYPLASGQVLRVDLRAFAPRDADLRRWVATWEELQFDPAFARLITRDQLAILARDRTRAATFFGGDIPTRRATVTDWQWDAAAPGTWRDPKDGRIHRGQWRERRITREVSVLDAGDVDVIRVNAGHVGAAMGELQELTGSAAPIVEWRYFAFRALETIKGKGLFRQLLGGLYYEFRGFRRAKAKGVTDEDLLFEDLGIGDGTRGSAARLFEKRRSDRRAAMFRSEVTGLPRLLELLPNLSTGVEKRSFVAISHDPSRLDIDIGAHPVRNLKRFRPKAREWIFSLPNGLHAFALTSADDGSLQEKAPDDVVRNRNIPSPYTTELSGALSCLSCHGPDDGLKPFRNDPQTLARSGLNVFGDLTDGGELIRDTIDRLAGQYQLDNQQIERALRSLRDDHAEGVLRVTGPWKRSKTQTDVVKLGSARITAAAYGYMFRQIDARQALREVGFDVAEKDAAAVFERVFPRVAGQLEDVAIAGLRAGIKIERIDLALGYADAMERAARARGEFAKGKK